MVEWAENILVPCDPQGSSRLPSALYIHSLSAENTIRRRKYLTVEDAGADSGMVSDTVPAYAGIDNLIF